MKYGLNPDKVKAFVHYQPTYYHFHVHFCHVLMESPSIQFEKAHSFSEIIQNIKLKSSYYQEVSLEYLIDEDHPLYQKYQTESSDF